MEGITKGNKGNLGGDGSVHNLDCGFMVHAYVKIDHVIHLIVYSLLYVNYISIKRLKKLQMQTKTPLPSLPPHK